MNIAESHVYVVYGRLINKPTKLWPGCYIGIGSKINKLLWDSINNVLTWKTEEGAASFIKELPNWFVQQYDIKVIQLHPLNIFC